MDISKHMKDLEPNSLLVPKNNFHTFGFFFFFLCLLEATEKEKKKNQLAAEVNWKESLLFLEKGNRPLRCMHRVQLETGSDLSQ